MSKKNLSGTAIEGGRAGGNKWERRHSHNAERASARDYCNKVKIDPEAYDEYEIESKDHVYKEFNDKLGSVKRWLASQVGSAWSQVHSELFQKFDTRTTAGRHIIFDHLLSDINEGEWDNRGRLSANILDYSNRHHSYYVDDNGLLQQNKKRDSYYYDVKLSVLEEAGRWLAGRMIGEKGGTLYWFTIGEGIWKANWCTELEKNRYYGWMEGRLDLKYYCRQNTEYVVKVQTFVYPPTYETITRCGDHWEHIENPAGFKRRGQLSASEEKYFRSFPEGVQNEILWYGNSRFPNT